jgi:hypothetical protein
MRRRDLPKDPHNGNLPPQTALTAFSSYHWCPVVHKQKKKEKKKRFFFGNKSGFKDGGGGKAVSNG